MIPTVRFRVIFDRAVAASAARRALVDWGVPLAYALVEGTDVIGAEFYVEADRVAWLDRVLANDHRVDGYVFFNSEGADRGI